MHTKLLEGQIIYYFPHTELFDEIQHQSAFMCKNIVSKEGEDLSERYAITDDEKGMFELCLGETMPDVYDTMKPLTHGISEAWFDSITGAEIKALNPVLSTLSVTNDAKYAVLRIQDNDAYNPNTVKVVDSALRSTIEQGVIANFYTRVMHPELTQVSATMFAGQNGALANRSIELRKKSKL